MSKSWVVFTMLGMVYVAHACACPTCVGRVSGQSAPFFSDECYCASGNLKNESSVQETSLPDRQAGSSDAKKGESCEH